MLAHVNSSIVIGLEGVPLQIEVDIASGLPVFSTVGLPDGAVRESKDRVKAAVKNSGYAFPNKKITVNLAPADLKKEGSGYDLPMAVGILSASGLIPPENLTRFSFIGELSLDGSIRGIKGILPMVLCSYKDGLDGVFVPEDNLDEAAVVQGIDVYPVKYLHDVVEVLIGEKDVQPVMRDIVQYLQEKRKYEIDFSDVKSNEHAKRALEVAAGGNHNVLFKGPPGSGKTMLAQRLVTILPDLTLNEALETTKIHSIAGVLPTKNPLVIERPFRSPHHTISDAGLVGGGTNPKPGEVSLATNGVLFLDELTEFKRHLLEMLRQPLEDGVITISRASTTVCFPADFILVAAYNPCPCGYHGDKRNRCICTETQRKRYVSKLSGPLLDRIDMQIEVPAISHEEMSSPAKGECSDEIRARVNGARKIQFERFQGEKRVTNNSSMTSKMIEKYCAIDQTTQTLLVKSVEKLGLSPRAYHRILKISRTIADLEGDEMIQKRHVAEAIQYRRIA